MTAVTPVTATATISVIPGYGATLHLSNRGFQFTSIPLPGVDEADPIESATKALTDEGWTPAGEWEQPNRWNRTVQIRLTERTHR